MNDDGMIRVGPGEWPLLQQVAALEREAFGPDALTPGILALYARAGAIYALREGGKVTAEALVLADLDDTGALLFSLAVAGPCRRAGRGRRLMEAVFEALRAAGRTHLQLTVAPDNLAARSLYLDRLGFTCIAEIPDCFGPGQHRLLLQCNLSSPPCRT